MAEAMKEAKVEQTEIDHMLTFKKDDAAVLAAVGLKGTDWLPKILKTGVAQKVS